MEQIKFLIQRYTLTESSIKYNPIFPLYYTGVMRQRNFSLYSLIASSIRTITKNYRLGYGTFVDKDAVPFIEGPRSP